MMVTKSKNLMIVCFVIGFSACCILTLAICSDFWLFTQEPVEDIWVDSLNTSNIQVVNMIVVSQSGLWRTCMFSKGKWINIKK